MLVAKEVAGWKRSGKISLVEAAGDDITMMLVQEQGSGNKDTQMVCDLHLNICKHHIEILLSFKFNTPQYLPNHRTNFSCYLLIIQVRYSYQYLLH